MKKKILIVDDNRDDLNTMEEILKETNYDVSCCENADEALELVENNGFNLMIVDIRLNVLSGEELLKLIKKKKDKNIKFIYVTILQKNDVDTSLVDGFIKKPFSPDDFLKEVKRVLK